MARIIALSLLFVAFLVAPVHAEEKDCVDPATLKNSTVSFAWYFTPEEKVERDVIGYRGTAWFYPSSRYLVTAQHVVQKPDMPLNQWREVELVTQKLFGDKEKIKKVQARLIEIIPGIPDGFAILELEKPYEGGSALTLRKTPLQKDEPVFSVVYPHEKLHYAKGKFHQIADETSPYKQAVPGAALFELYDYDERKNDRYVTDHGASGAAIVDCKGAVVAMVNELFVKNMPGFGGNVMRITTAWGEPNNTGTLIAPLFGFTPEK